MKIKLRFDKLLSIKINKIVRHKFSTHFECFRLHHIKLLFILSSNSLVFIGESHQKMHCHQLTEIDIWSICASLKNTKQFLGGITRKEAHRPWTTASHFSRCIEQGTSHRNIRSNAWMKERNRTMFDKL